MDSVDLTPLLEQLDDNIDDLEEILEPLLTTKLSNVTKTMPLLDKAKLQVLITYSIESLLFSYLRLHGVNAKDHPVFKELTRVKQYFTKISEAETGPTKRENLSLNKQAAGRIIKHALAGNDRYDLERAEQQAKERATAQLKLRQIGGKRKAVEIEVEVDDKHQANHTSSQASESVDQMDLSFPDAGPTPGGDEGSVEHSRKKKKSHHERINASKEHKYDQTAEVENRTQDADITHQIEPSLMEAGSNHIKAGLNGLNVERSKNSKTASPTLYNDPEHQLIDLTLDSKDESEGGSFRARVGDYASAAKSETGQNADVNSSSIIGELDVRNFGNADITHDLFRAVDRLRISSVDKISHQRFKVRFTTWEHAKAALDNLSSDYKRAKRLGGPHVEWSKESKRQMKAARLEARGQKIVSHSSSSKELGTELLVHRLEHLNQVRDVFRKEERAGITLIQKLAVKCYHVCFASHAQAKAALDNQPAENKQKKHVPYVKWRRSSANCSTSLSRAKGKDEDAEHATSSASQSALLPKGLFVTNMTFTDQADQIRELFRVSDAANITSIDRLSHRDFQVKFSTHEHAQAALDSLPEQHKRPSQDRARVPFVRWLKVKGQPRKAEESRRMEESLAEQASNPGGQNAQPSKKAMKNQLRRENAGKNHHLHLRDKILHVNCPACEEMVHWSTAQRSY